MALAQTYRRSLLERAQDQYGYVTTRDAEDLGIPAVELRKLAQRGGLRHVARGIYRFDEVPVTGHDQFMEAVLTVGPGAHLTRDAVLSLHDLGLVNPSKIRVGTDRRVRGQLPAFVDVVRVPPGTGASRRTKAFLQQPLSGLSLIAEESSWASAWLRQQKRRRGEDY